MKQTKTPKIIFRSNDGALIVAFCYFCDAAISSTTEFERCLKTHLKEIDGSQTQDITDRGAPDTDWPDPEPQHHQSGLVSDIILETEIKLEPELQHEIVLEPPLSEICGGPKELDNSAMEEELGPMVEVPNENISDSANLYDLTAFLECKVEGNLAIDNTKNLTEGRGKNSTKRSINGDIKLGQSNVTVKEEEPNDSAGNFICHVCFECFQSTAALTVHITIHAENEKSKSIFTCDNCKKVFETKVSIEQHMETHKLKPRRFRCPDCGRWFKFKTSLQNHQRNKHPNDDDIWTCKQCSRSYKTYSSYQNHIQYHRDEGKFVCKICHKAFNRITHLKDHRSVHTEERKFECMTCGNKFKTVKTLQSHELTHTDERRFKCFKCGLKFKRRDNLTRHLQLITCIA